MSANFKCPLGNVFPYHIMLTFTLIKPHCKYFFVRSQHSHFPPPYNLLLLSTDYMLSSVWVVSIPYVTEQTVSDGSKQNLIKGMR